MTILSPLDCVGFTKLRSGILLLREAMRAHTVKPGIVIILLQRFKCTDYVDIMTDYRAIVTGNSLAGDAAVAFLPA